mmetsp:Transcript_28952/g.57870  ORF Transcript_28952/g.57870 Transcript_28952/m.57870 type:complete len:277 (+) Transcript_28952:295-1125(+)
MVSYGHAPDIPNRQDDQQRRCLGPELRRCPAPQPRERPRHVGSRRRLPAEPHLERPPRHHHGSRGAGLAQHPRGRRRRRPPARGFLHPLPLSPPSAPPAKLRRAHPRQGRIPPGEPDGLRFGPGERRPPAFRRRHQRRRRLAPRPPRRRRAFYRVVVDDDDDANKPAAHARPERRHPSAGVVASPGEVAAQAVRGGAGLEGEFPTLGSVRAVRRPPPQLRVSDNPVPYVRPCPSPRRAHVRALCHPGVAREPQDEPHHGGGDGGAGHQQLHSEEPH